MSDYNRFFEQIVSYVLFQRLAETLKLATDETFCEKVFGAYSPSARLRVIKKALNFETFPLWETNTEGMQ